MKVIKVFMGIFVFLFWTYFVWTSGFNSGKMVSQSSTEEVFISILSQRGAIVPVYLSFDEYTTTAWDITERCSVDDLILLEQVSPDILWWYQPVLEGRASVHSPVPGGNFILR